MTIRRSVLLSLLSFLSMLAAPPAALALWSDTATGVLPLNATPLGPAPATMPMHIFVTLHFRNEPQLDQFIASITTAGNPAFGSFLSSEQFAASYSPTPEQAQAVADYLSANGLRNVRIAGNRLLIEADATPAAVAAAFNTPIALYALNGNTVYANTAVARVPDTLAPLVVAVGGLQNAIRPRPPEHRTLAPVLGTRAPAAAPTATAQALPLPAFPVAYHAQSLPTAAANIGAIYMSGDPSSVADDLKLAQEESNIPVTPVDIITVDGTGSANAGFNGEFDLDSQSSNGMAGAFTKEIWYNDGAGNFTPAFNQWVTDNLARAMSTSVSECEYFAAVDGTEAATDTVFKQAVAQGQTLFASSGDDGYACPPPQVPNGTNAGPPAQLYPSASPYIVSVGGTTLSTFPDFSYGGETGWTNAGGGTSLTEPAPQWQIGVAPNTSIGRAAPDIGFDAAPGSGAVTIVAGSPETVGGTSLSAPLAMGAWSRIEAASGNQLGFAAPLFYALSAKGASSGYPTAITGLHDITTGSDDVYQSKVGYDFVTGVGTPDLCVMTNLLVGGSTDFCAAPAQPLINTVYPDTTTIQTCTVPGMQLVTDPSGDGTTPLASQDLTSLSIAEPADKPGMLVFTLGVASLSTIPRNTAWQADFLTPDGKQWYVQMDTYAADGTPAFTYGGPVYDPTTNTDNITDIGPLDSSSSYSQTANTITLVLDRSKLSVANPGDELTYVYGLVYVLVGATRGLLATNDTTSVSLYNLRADDLCSASPATPTPPATGSAGAPGAAAPSARFGGAFGLDALLFAALGAALRRRRSAS